MSRSHAPRSRPGSLELVLRSTATTGEGPLWDDRRGVLWWVDIPAGLVHRLEPDSGADAVIEVGSPVGALALREDGTLLAALADRLAVLDPQDRSVTTAVRLGSEPGLRCNDGKPDPTGRYWIGRVADDGRPGAGSLLRIGPDRDPVPVLTGLTMPNGLGWSLDGRTMYFVDSSWCEVRAFPFEPSSGELGEPRTLVRFPDDGSVPDGLAIDAEGCLWVARWGAGCVVRVSPDGEVVDRIHLPVSQPASCTFGGVLFDELYVTTAREDLDAGRLEREPLAGSVFRCRPGVRGRAADRLGW